MAKRPRHPDKDIEAAVKHAEEHGWTCIMSDGHAWALLRCPFGRRGGCQTSVWSTPKNPRRHADRIRRDVDHCPHAEEASDENGDDPEAPDDV